MGREGLLGKGTHILAEGGNSGGPWLHGERVVMSELTSGFLFKLLYPDPLLGNRNPQAIFFIHKEFSLWSWNLRAKSYFSITWGLAY